MALYQLTDASEVAIRAVPEGKPAVITSMVETMLTIPPEAINGPASPPPSHRWLGGDGKRLGVRSMSACIVSPSRIINYYQRFRR
jgi:hypothetical protein